MKITKAHWEFWKARRWPVPSWAAGLAEKPKVDRFATIDALINSQVEWTDRRMNSDKSLAMFPLRQVRDRLRHPFRLPDDYKNLQAFMEEYVRDCHPTGVRRVPTYRRLLRRLTKREIPATTLPYVMASGGGDK
jgi:hypothetical protein